ncbi:MAG TPA: UDP-N-acetylmuramoyl-tripeptide--D-alanyl-D-alanine ligase [Candidatus Limnocylindria bacterium]|nr:UDP-N-acetylmuramoyl-tripeptide--D-alanyl-D-alanine ligase [Candidatus Limnocylindria bacterium]
MTMVASMDPRSLSYIAKACAGEQLTGSPDAMARRACTDSRVLGAGDVFFALSGDKFDGHNFLKEAMGKDAAAVVVNRQRLPVPPLTCAVIAVEDTRHALSRFAAEYRHDFKLPTIAVAGSNGKTTTKELIASVLRQKLSTIWSEASFNNDIGVPLTLLRVELHHEAGVFEVGTNHPGELAPLVAMIQPQFGVITSIGREHLEFFGDVEGVAQEEGWLAELLPASGKLFLNGDTSFADVVAERSRAPIVRIGFGDKNDWRIQDIYSGDRSVTFSVSAPEEKFSGEYHVNLLGRHQATNATLAIAVGAEFGLSIGEIRRGLASCQPPKMRLQIFESHGVRILNDAYNANADSVLAALQTLSDFPCSGRRIAVLGDMAELGEHTFAAHAEVGRKVAELGEIRLVTVGAMASHTADAARAAGLNDVTECSDVAEATAVLKQMAREGDVILLKASRVTGLERVSESLS